MGNGNLTAKEDISIENLYNFIRASLVALQPTDGFGEADLDRKSTRLNSSHT